MSHYHLEGLNSEWRLVRETTSSQIFRGTTSGGLEFSADFHFTPPHILTVSLVFVGDKGAFTDGITHDIFEDMEKIALRRGDYVVIDYSLAYSETISEGNYSISDEWRKVFAKWRK
jgi:hypothetical protein